MGISLAIVMPGLLKNPAAATAAKKRTGINITTEGKKHLGAPSGSPSIVENFVSCKVEEWTEAVEKLAAVAGSQPQAAYAAFVHGTKMKWNYFCRTIPKL